jgi:hypothetical protein
MRPAAGNDTGSSGDRFLSIFNESERNRTSSWISRFEKTIQPACDFQRFFSVFIFLCKMYWNLNNFNRYIFEQKKTKNFLSTIQRNNLR